MKFLKKLGLLTPVEKSFSKGEERTSIALADLVAAAVIVSKKENRILLVERIWGGKKYLTFPTEHMEYSESEVDLETTSLRLGREEFRKPVDMEIVGVLGSLISPNSRGEKKFIQIILHSVDSLDSLHFGESPELKMTIPDFFSGLEENLDGTGRPLDRLGAVARGKFYEYWQKSLNGAWVQKNGGGGMTEKENQGDSSPKDNNEGEIKS